MTWGPYNWEQHDKFINRVMRYWGLEEWWLKEFTEDERRYLGAICWGYDPNFAEDGDDVIEEDDFSDEEHFYISGTRAHFLKGWAVAPNPEDRGLALKILKKAEELALADNDILSLHFVYQTAIEINYRWREEFRDALLLAVEACRKQIAIAAQAAQAFRRESDTYKRQLPAHVGYRQLAEILRKQGDYAQAIRICREAQSNGWQGTWDRTIQTLEKRLASR